MYAVIETGGKQYRVEVGTELQVELLDAVPGDALTFDRVLLVADGDTAAIGRPVVTNASVTARVVGRERGEKVIAFKYRPKARRRVKKGHRQELTHLRISDIVLDGHSAAADVAQAEAARARDHAKLEEAARRQAAADAELAAKLAAEKPVAPKPAPKAGRSAKAQPTAAAKAESTAAPKAGSKPAPKADSKAATGSGTAKSSASKAPGAKAVSAKATSKAATERKSTTPKKQATSPAKRSTKKES